MRFAKLWLFPIVLGIAIDGVSELLKKVGGFIVKEISDRMKYDLPVSWDAIVGLLFMIVAVIFALYFLTKTYSKFESHEPGTRTAVLVLTLVLIGSTNLWAILLERPEIRKSYDEVTPNALLNDVKNKFAGEHPIVSLAGENNYGCTQPCKTSLLYVVPKIFGETFMTFDFDANNRLLRKDWLD